MYTHIRGGTDDDDNNNNVDNDIKRMLIVCRNNFLKSLGFNKERELRNMCEEIYIGEKKIETNNVNSI